MNFFNPNDNLILLNNIKHIFQTLKILFFIYNISSYISKYYINSFLPIIIYFVINNNFDKITNNITLLEDNINKSKNNNDDVIDFFIISFLFINYIAFTFVLINNINIDNNNNKSHELINNLD